MTEPSSSRYSDAGVDIDKGNEFISRIKNIVADTHGRGVLTDIGGFSGLFAIGNAGLDDPVGFFEQYGVGLSDGKEFGMPGFCRLKFGCPRSRLSRALDRLQDAMASRKDQKFT